MTDSIQLKSFQRLKSLIAAQLEWGESDQWSNYDFEKLADRVAEKTGVTLSVSTLKRIFGRVNYGSAPSLTTLNTLARFTGFEDWRSFTNALIEEPPVQTANAHEPIIEKAEPSKKERRFTLLKIVLPAAALILLAFITANLYSPKHTHDSSGFSFTSKTILTEGLPNSVVFDYDASAAHDKDSVFIAQSWDTRRKLLVNKNDKHYSSIYYYPGYFRAKLMIGNEIIREHDIQIKTDGWLGLIEAEWGKEPLYFKKTEITRQNEIAIDDGLLKKYNVNLQPVPPAVRLYNQKEIHGINTDNFTFETQVKTDFSAGANACQRIEILLHAKNDILIIPLVNPACIGDIYLAAYGFMTNSEKDDLSGFGCNLYEWTKLKVACKNGHVAFFINDKKVYAANIKNPPSEIVGLQYRFKGVAAVRNAHISGIGNRQVVF
ncbi:MAG TPA: hypothetical protein VJ111_12235 [Chitinophagaceae bacterium]|nr:hypothetical protein [Chitinophagaceae bacterium]